MNINIPKINRRDTILINGEAYDWASVNVTIGSTLLFGITEINFNEAQDISPIYNDNVFPLGYGLGKMKITASLTISMDEMDIFRASANEFRVQNIPPFDITVSFFDKLENIPVLYVIKNCKITNNGLTLTQNSPNSLIKLEIIASGINTNGGDVLYNTAEQFGSLVKPFEGQVEGKIVTFSNNLEKKFN